MNLFFNFANETIKLLLSLLKQRDLVFLNFLQLNILALLSENTASLFESFSVPQQSIGPN